MFAFGCSVETSVLQSGLTSMFCQFYAAFQSRRANRAHDFPSCANRSNHVPTLNFTFAHLEKWRRFFWLSLHCWENRSHICMRDFFRNHFMLGNNFGVFLMWLLGLDLGWVMVRLGLVRLGS